MLFRHYYKRDDGLAQRARDVDILTVVRGLQPKLRRVSSSEYAGPCPLGCARRDGFVICPAKAIFLCRPSGCGGDVISMVMHALGCGFIEACEHITGESHRPVSLPKPRNNHESDHARRMRESGFKIWATAAPIAQTVGEQYFCSRAIRCPLPASLRFLAKLEHWPTRQMLPAIVARVDGVDSAFLGVHLTFLTIDGKTNAALGGKRKLMLGGTRGGTVRLGEPDGELTVAEGIETALSARAADAWEPLVAIADRAGGAWPARARAAALSLSGEGKDDDNIDALLLADVRAVFVAKGGDRIAGKDLIAALNALEDRPWSEWSRGRPMSQSQMSRRIGEYGIVSGAIRTGFGAETARGYYFRKFEDAFARYLPPDTPSSPGSGRRFR